MRNLVERAVVMHVSNFDETSAQCLELSYLDIWLATKDGWVLSKRGIVQDARIESA